MRQICTAEESLSGKMFLSRRFHTVSADDVPMVMRQHFVINGYRQPQQSWSYYLTSLFQWHNETVNIWSHLLTTISVFYQFLLYNQHYQNTTEVNKLAVFTMGCCATTFLSTIAHLLGSKSVKSHQILFLLDYSGITLYGYATSIGSLYVCGEKWLYNLIEPYFIFASFGIAACTFVVNCTAKLWISNHHSKLRKLLMVLPHVLFGTFMSIPVLARYWSCYYDDTCKLSSLNHITIVISLFIVEALAYTLHIPERWAPGRFDMIGQSHQIFHFVSWVTMAIQMYAVNIDIRSGHSEQFDFSFTKGLASFILLFCIHICLIVLCLPIIDQQARSNYKLWKKKNTKTG